MQKFLNKEYFYFKNLLNKNTFIIIVFALFIIIGILFSVLGWLCNVKFYCNNNQEYYLQTIGIVILIFTLCFILVPYIIRILLNCIFYKQYLDQKQLYIISDSPLNSV